MKALSVFFLIIFAGFVIIGCSEKNEETALKENEEEDSNFKPGTFTPGTFKPGKFEPGTFEPGTFTPGTFKPGTFEPGNFDAKVTVSVEENEITLEVPSHLLFDFDKFELKSEAIEVLDQLGEDLNAYDGAHVSINGHTDSQGNAEYNQGLSENRAKKVQSYLETIVNTERIHIETQGYGETKPIASNETEDGREKNRRVEIIVEPLVKK